MYGYYVCTVPMSCTGPALFEASCVGSGLQPGGFPLVHLEFSWLFGVGRTGRQLASRRAGGQLPPTDASRILHRFSGIGLRPRPSDVAPRSAQARWGRLSFPPAPRMMNPAPTRVWTTFLQNSIVLPRIRCRGDELLICQERARRVLRRVASWPQERGSLERHGAGVIGSCDTMRRWSRPRVLGNRNAPARFCINRPNQRPLSY